MIEPSTVWKSEPAGESPQPHTVDLGLLVTPALDDDDVQSLAEEVKLELARRYPLALISCTSAGSAAAVAAGIGMWTGSYWSRTLALNILAFHAVVFAGLVALSQIGQTVAPRSIFAMMFRTFTWLVIYSLLKWKRQQEGGK